MPKSPKLKLKLYPLFSLLMSEGAGGEERIKIHNEQDRGSGYIWKATTGRFPARIMLLGGASYPEQRTPSSFLFTNSHYIWGWILSGIYLLPILSLPELLSDRHPIREAAPCWSNFGTTFWCQGKFPKEDSKLPCSLCSAFFLFTSPQTHP